MRSSPHLLVSLLAFGSLGALPATRADISLPAVFGAHMVLQRDQPIPVWGRADAGEKVTVELGSIRAETVTATDGSWRVDLPAQPAGGPCTLVVQGKNHLRFDDVLLGDVWLCSGQSNMTLRVDKARDARSEIAAAKFPAIRLFSVTRTVADSPQLTCKGEWTACSPESVGAFSAVGYFFGRKLHQDLGVPVGLIHSSWGGTTAEAWTPRAVLEASPELSPILTRWAQELAEFPQKKADFDANRDRLLAEWKVAAANAKKSGRMPPAEPRLRTGPGTQYQPAGLYHAMIAPLVPFGLRGVIWYQGEGNAQRAHQYRTLFPALITAWRDAWQRPELPFLFVQLPNLARQPEPSKSGWAELREAQAMALSLPQTGMAVTIDVGDPQDLHPINKQPVGERLALAANHLVYGAPAADCVSPRYRSSDIRSRNVHITFAPPALALATSDRQAPRGFTIAGADHRFVPAKARIDGDTLVVWSDEVPLPAAVRYAWADNPSCNLVSATGLPVSPFRTDDWPEVTTGKK